MKHYTFYTICTVVDIGDGVQGAVQDGRFTGTINLARLVECIQRNAYPMMVSVTSTDIHLGRDTNSEFYSLPSSWGYCKVSTFKFSLEVDVDLDLNGIPLVMPVDVNGVRITKFSTNGEFKNISVHKRTF